MKDALTLARRDLLRAGALGSLTLGFGGLFPAWAQSGSTGLASPPQSLGGESLRLVVDHSSLKWLAAPVTQ